MKKLFLKSVITGVIVTSMLLTTALNAFAEDQTIDVSGSVQSTIVEVTLPISISFVINPNANTELGEKVLTSVPATIVSTTNAPVDVEILGIKADVGTETKVVSESTYTPVQWEKFGKNDSNSKIALGIKADTEPTIWSPEEIDGVDPIIPVGIINLTNLGSKSISVDARHGYAFDSAKNLDYKLFLRVGLTE